MSTGPPDQSRARSAAQLLDQARRGSVRATARLLTYLESGGPRAARVTATLVGLPRTAAVVGLTGPPGVGKSTLTTALVRLARARQERVAVLAVDPSSPFSGGALLGDRVRMADHATDPGVFIRSMSARGHLGGMSAATPAAVDLMSALGFGLVLVETVGVGQNEIEVMRLADSVLVVTAPGLGDGIQAAKAGILEIADLLVVNKADREGAAATVRELKTMLALARHRTAGPGRWRVPVLTTVAADGTGVDALAAAIAGHREYLRGSGADRHRRRARTAVAIDTIVTGRLQSVLVSEAGRTELLRLAGAVADESGDATAAADRMWEWIVHRSGQAIDGQ